MNFRQTKEAVSAAADAVTRLVDGGALRVYGNSAQPADADLPVPGVAVLLAEIPYASPAFLPAIDGVAEARVMPVARGLASGTPRWCRSVAANGRAVFDGSAGQAIENPDLVIETAMILAGAEIVVANLRYKQPQASV